MDTYLLVGLVLGAIVLVGVIITLIVHFTKSKPETIGDDSDDKTAGQKQAEDCMNLFINKLRSFAQTTKDMDQHAVTGEVTEYNNFCKSIDAGIAVDCPDLEVTMSLYNLKKNYYEGLRPEAAGYREGQEIQFVNDNGTLKPPSAYKLLNCRAIPLDTVFRFVIKHNNIEDDVAFHISIPDAMGKVMKA